MLRRPSLRLLPLVPALLALASEPSPQCRVQRLAAGGQGAAGDQLGRAVALHGTTAVVGAWGADDAGAESGAAYVFERVGAVWYPSVRLVASDAASGDRFGFAVACRGDALVVGAPRADVSGHADAGAIYVFDRDDRGTPDPLDDLWTERKITAGDAAATDEFGHAVAMDGERIVVGARQDDDLFGNSGSVYVLEELAGVWIQSQKLGAGAFASPADQFGQSVAVAGDLIAVGSHREDDAATDAGAVYVFGDTTTDTLGGFALLDRLLASDAAPDDELGISVALGGDTVVAGAWLADDGGSESGAAYVFERDDAGTPDDPLDDAWVETQKLLDPAGAPGDRYGFAVAAASDSPYVVVGSYRDDDVFLNAGALFVWRRDEGPTPSPLDDLHVPAGVVRGRPSQDELGIAVALAGDAFLVGVHFDDQDGTNSGSAFVGSASARDFPSFSGEDVVLSAVNGGSQVLEINTCVEGAAGLYFVLGSLGSQPGFDVGGFHVGLNPDYYFRLTFRQPNSSVLNPSLGPFTDPDARATVTFTLPPGSVALIGGQVCHAYGVFLNGLAFVSETVCVPIGP